MWRSIRLKVSTLPTELANFKLKFLLFLAYGNLGNILKAQGRVEEAEAAYRTALQHRLNMADVHYNLGLLLQESGKEKLEFLFLYDQTNHHFLLIQAVVKRKP